MSQAAALALGQGLSVLIALTGTFSSLLIEQGVSLPAAQSLINYVGLGLVYGSLLAWRRQRPKAEWYKYAVLALADVLANFCVVAAYRYTSLTSVTLLDCFTIPGVLLLSWLFLDAHFKLGHWIGAAICLAGLALLVTTDRAFSRDSKAQRPLLGDALVVMGATLYSICNVAQEKLLGKVGRVELLAMLGLCGTIWGSILAVALEGHEIVATNWTPQVVLLFLGFSAALFSFSSLTPYVLMWGSAAILNLSLLSSDLWAALARIALFGGFTPLSGVSFVASFFLVGSGLVVYYLAGGVYASKVHPAYQGLEEGGTLQTEESPPRRGQQGDMEQDGKDSVAETGDSALGDTLPYAFPRRSGSGASEGSRSTDRFHRPAIVELEHRETQT